MSMLNYGAPQQMTQSAMNVQQAFQLMGPVINQLSQIGNITPQEAQTIMTAMQQPASAQAIQNRILQTYGEMVVAPQILQQTVQNLVLTAAQKIRVNQQNVPVPNVGYVPQYAPTTAPQVENTAFNSRAIFGDQANTSANYQYGRCEPTVNRSPVPEQPATPVEVPQRMPTNTPIQIDLTDDYRVLAAPVWTVVPPAEKLPFHTVLEVVGDHCTVSCGNCMVESSVIRLETPMASAEGAIADVGVNHPELMDREKTFANVVVFKQIVIGRMSFNPAKDLYLRCRDAMKEDPGTNGVLNVMKILGERNDDAGKLLSSMTLDLFNNAASVNFMKANATNTGMHRLCPFESMTQLSRLVIDSGDYEDWKTEKDAFIQALKQCLKVSFNRLFNSDSQGYLDISTDDKGNPKDNRARLLVLNDERFGFRFKSGEKEEVSRMIPFLAPADADANIALRDSITSKLKNIFPLVLERKMLVHNLKLPIIAPGKYSAEWLHHTPEAYILTDFFAKHGTMETVNVEDLEQLRHPLMLGSGYEGQLLVRRI